MAECLGQSNTNIETLNLSCNPIGTELAIRIADAVSMNPRPRLRHLLVANCEFTLKALIALTTSLDKHLEALVLDRPLLTTNEEEGIDHFSRLLSTHATLSEVSLKYNKIHDFGALAIATALGMNTSLVYLNLECNHISVKGAEALSSYLMKYNRLSSLQLSYNAIGDQGAIALGQAFAHNTSLRHITLKTNSIGPVGLLALAAGLEKNNTLQYITIFGNEFDDESCRAFHSLITNRFPYVGVTCDIEIYVVDGVYKVAEKDS